MSIWHYVQYYINQIADLYSWYARHNFADRMSYTYRNSWLVIVNLNINIQLNATFGVWAKK